MRDRNKKNRRNALRGQRSYLVHSRTEREGRSFLERFPLALFSLVMIFVLIYLVFFSPIFRINSINIEGTGEMESLKIEEVTKKSLEERLLKNNILFINSKSLEKRIEEEFTDFKKIEIKKDFPRTINVFVKNRGFGIIWQTQDKKYLLNDEGTIISEDISEKELPIVLDNSNLPVGVGDKVVTVSFINFVTSLVNNLPQKTGISIVSLSVEETTLEVWAMTTEGWRIYFSVNRDLESQLNTLNIVLPEIKKKKSKLEYIDLRIENKVFYK